MKEMNRILPDFPWGKGVQIKEIDDIYLTKTYAELYTEKEQGVAKTFDFVSPNGKIRNVFIKRSIPYTSGNQEYYDITTPYGYGGPMIAEAVNLESLLEEYFEAFHQYCLQENIVSEFVRFHLLENQEVREQFKGETQLIGQHIVRDLKQQREEDFHKSVLQSVRRAERLGVKVIFDETGQYLDEFLEVYTSTMDWHEAKEFYYFDKSFFEQIHNSLNGHFLYVHAFLEEKLIGTRLILHGDKYAYYFLGGALREYSTYKAASLLDYKIIDRLQEEGKEYYVFGGGYHGEDGLYKYKNKFSQRGKLPFYVGKKVHQPEIYEELVERRSLEGNFDPDTLFFPLYRS